MSKSPEHLVSSIITHEEPLLFEKSVAGRAGYSLPELDVPETETSSSWNAADLRECVEGFPELSENEVVRHFTRLSQKNYAIDLGFYPLGSCTMKYNPKINEEVARASEFSNLHPLWPNELIQPALGLQFELEKLLKQVTGFSAFTLQPSAGAHGEYTGMKMIQAYHRSKGSNHKKKVLIPEAAHGTNPATCAMLDYEIVSIPQSKSGVVEVEDVKPLIDQDVAGIMMTNPNTCGLFESHIKEIADLVHSVDGLFYMDGANFNAILGITKPADLGVDVMHINLHKTFSTPHGGGGPGAGAVGVASVLQEFLPTPIVRGEAGSYRLDYDLENSIGRIGGYYGNFSIHIRALAYMLSIGTTPDAKSTYLKEIAEASVLNANYIRARLRGHYNISYDDRNCMHEVLISDDFQSRSDIKTKDIAKRLMDYGYHPMTVYFPLVVHGAMLIEPTESETKESIDDFCDVMIKIAEECKQQPEIVRNAPHKVFRKKVDELKAQKEPRLRWSSRHSA